MSDEWDEDSSGESAAPAPAPAPAAAAPAARKPPVVSSKFAGEDEESDGPVSDWEASSEEEEEVKPAAPVAPPKKKGSLKAKLAEISAAKAAKQDEDDDDDEDYDEDAVLDPRAKAKLDQERELKADLNNAVDLLGAAALGGTSSKELDSLISAQPRTKDDFIEFSNKIIAYIVKKHQDKPLYAAFLEHHVRQLAIPLKDIEVRKVASGLTALANEKQKEQREKASGKKKKAPSKPVLGASKVGNKFDTSTYDEALDDFGDRPDDFM